MAKTITPINPSTFTFDGVVDTINTIIDAISTEVVTVDSTANGATTTGNGFVYGVFGSNVMIVTTELRGGNTTASDTIYVTSNVNINASSRMIIGSATTNLVINSTSLTISNSTVTFSLRKPTSAQVSAGSFFLNANGSYTEIDSQFEANTSGTSAQLIDSFVKADHRACEYTAYIQDNSTTAFQMTKVMVVHDGTDAYQNEFGVLPTTAILGTFSANANTTHVRLYVSPTVADAKVVYKRSLLSV